MSKLKIKQIIPAQPGWKAEFCDDKGTFIFDVICWSLMYNEEEEIEFIVGQIAIDDSDSLWTPDEMPDVIGSDTQFRRYFLS